MTPDRGLEVGPRPADTHQIIIIGDAMAEEPRERIDHLLDEHERQIDAAWHHLAQAQDNIDRLRLLLADRLKLTA